MEKTTRFAIPDEPHPTGPRPKVVYAGHHSVLVDDIAKEIVIVETDGSKEIKYPFKPTHRMFAETDGPPNMWALFREKPGLIKEHFEKFMNERKEKA
jgi:hypothetical protein